MARKPVGYWENRSTKLMKNIEYQTEHTINSLIQAYNNATSDINKEIVKIFNNYAKDGVLDKNVLKQLLTTKESDTYYKNLLSVINNNITDENIKKKLLAKYNAPAYAYRISRYEALQNNIDVRLKELANIEQNITRIRYINTIKEGYYHTIFDTQKGFGIGFSFAQVDERTIKLLLNEKWVDNANFSQRIWKNSEKMNEYIKTNLTAASMSGKSINKISEELSDYMQVGLFESTRLVRTEVNHFANESEMLAYDELEIEKYQFIATLDKRTCVHCGRMDGRIFKLKEKKAGVNYPPLHPNDRCTTVAVFDDDTIDDLKRRARDENGRPILVSQDMDYENWSMQYAPEQYKKYFINPKLPKIKPADNSVLEKQLGFYNETQNLKFIPKDSIISNVHIIAGKGTQTIFRSANKYAQQYGGKADEWTKRAGKIESSKYIFDVHWVEHSKFGKYDFKLKGKTIK